MSYSFVCSKNERININKLSFQYCKEHKEEQ